MVLRAGPGGREVVAVDVKNRHIVKITQKFGRRRFIGYAGRPWGTARRMTVIRPDSYDDALSLIPGETAPMVRKQVTLKDQYYRLTQFFEEERRGGLTGWRVDPKRIARKFGFTKLKVRLPTQGEIMSYECTNGDAFCGPQYGATKGKEREKIAEEAAEIWRTFREEECFDAPPPLWYVGGREKPMSYTDFMMDKPARMILMPTGEEEFVSGRFVHAVLGWLKNNITPAVLGVGPYQGNWRRLGKEFEGSTRFLEMDYSGYDATVSEELIRRAFQIISYSIDPEEEDAVVSRWLNWVMDSFINSYIVMPDRFVFQKSKGIPSGSVWTSLIGTLVNYIVIVEAMAWAGIDSRSTTVRVCGDDSLIGFKVGEEEKMKTLPMWIEARFGVTVKEWKITSKWSKNPEDRGETPKFLGRYWDPEGLPWREPKESALQLVSPKGKINSIDDAYVEAFMDNPRDLKLQEIVQRRLGDVAFDELYGKVHRAYVGDGCRRTGHEIYRRRSGAIRYIGGRSHKWRSWTEAILYGSSRSGRWRIRRNEGGTEEANKDSFISWEAVIAESTAQQPAALRPRRR